MPTIDASYFFAELTIAQKSTVDSSLSMFIDEHEERLLTGLFGYTLYKLYKAGISAGTPDPKWISIRDGKEYTNRSGIATNWPGLKFSSGTAKKSLIANYVYWHWMADLASSTTGTGEKKAAAKNSIDASPGAKMVRAWNQMVDWNKELIEFLLSNESDYPEFMDHYGRIPRTLICKQNVFGI